jgi:hypothetical protein
MGLGLTTFPGYKYTSRILSRRLPGPLDQLLLVLPYRRGDQAAGRHNAVILVLPEIPEANPVPLLTPQARIMDMVRSAQMASITRLDGEWWLLKPNADRLRKAMIYTSVLLTLSRSTPNNSLPSTLRSGLNVHIFG